MRQTKIFSLLILVMLVDCIFSQSNKNTYYDSHNIVSKALLTDNCIIIAFNSQKLFICFDLNFKKKWSLELTEGCSDFKFNPGDSMLTMLQVISKTNRRYLRYNPFVDKIPQAKHDFKFPDGLLSVTCLEQNRVFAFGETYLLIQDIFGNRPIYKVTGKDWLQLSPFIENEGKITGYISTDECDIACKVIIDSSLNIINVSPSFRDMKWKTESVIVIRDSIFAISSGKDGKRFYSFFNNQNLKIKIEESKMIGDMILEDFSLSRNIMALDDPINHKIVLTNIN
jgi:hypothetical protein